jgi:hypothetical protein
MALRRIGVAGPHSPTRGPVPHRSNNRFADWLIARRKLQHAWANVAQNARRQASAAIASHAAVRDAIAAVGSSGSVPAAALDDADEQLSYSSCSAVWDALLRKASADGKAGKTMLGWVRAAIHCVDCFIHWRETFVGHLQTLKAAPAYFQRARPLTCSTRTRHCAHGTRCWRRTARTMRTSRIPREAWRRPRRTKCERAEATRLHGRGCRRLCCSL